MQAFACDLTQIPAEERDHHLAVGRQWMEAVRKVNELDNGYAFELSASLVMTVGEFISRERLCCPFFTFQVEVHQEQMVLRLTGEEGVKAVLQDLVEEMK